MNALKWLSIFLVGVAIGYTFAPSEKDVLESNLATDEVIIIEQDQAPKPNKPLPSTSGLLEKNREVIERVEKHETQELANTKARNQILEQDYQALKEQLSEAMYELSQLREELGLSKRSEISDEDLTGLVPEAYAQNLTHYRGAVRDAIYEFHQEPEDLGTGFDFSYQIKSFIESHPDSFGVEVNSISCKNTTCQMLIKELEQPSWHNIFNDLKAQDWWQFSSTNASSRNDGQKASFIYYFLSNPQRKAS